MPKKKTAQSTSKKSAPSKDKTQEEHFESFNDTSNALIDSMNGLSKTLNSMMNLFDRASESMAQEEQGQSMVSENFGPLMNKVNTILDQNNKIAQGMVTILEQIEETKKEQDAKIEKLHSLLTKQGTGQAQNSPASQPEPIKPEPQFRQPSFGQQQQQTPFSERTQQPQPNTPPQQQQQKSPFQNQPTQNQSTQNPNEPTDDFKMDDLFNNYPPQHTGNQTQGTQQPPQNTQTQQQRPNPTPLNDMPPIDPYATQNPQLKKTDLSGQGQGQQKPQQSQGDTNSKKPIFKSLFKNK
jgi:archaellum component FlaC